jgi:hypothetical protein
MNKKNYAFKKKRRTSTGMSAQSAKKGNALPKTML